MEGQEWSPLVIFPETTTTNGTHLIKFRKGAFIGMRSVQPVYIKVSENMVHHTWECMPFALFFTLWASTFCYYTVTLYIMPEFTPTRKMLSLRADSGMEDWEIYAECVRSAMAKHGGFGICNQPIREKLQYEEFMIENQLTMKVGDEMFFFKENANKVLTEKYAEAGGRLSPLLKKESVNIQENL